MPDKEKVKLVSTEKRKADDIDQIKDLKKVKLIVSNCTHLPYCTVHSAHVKIDTKIKQPFSHSHTHAHTRSAIHEP